jgi:hypothetical protein
MLRTKLGNFQISRSVNLYIYEVWYNCMGSESITGKGMIWYFTEQDNGDT